MWNIICYASEIIKILRSTRFRHDFNSCSSIYHINLKFVNLGNDAARITMRVDGRRLTVKNLLREKLSPQIHNSDTVTVVIRPNDRLLLFFSSLVN